MATKLPHKNKNTELTELFGDVPQTDSELVASQISTYNPGAVTRRIEEIQRNLIDAVEDPIGKRSNPEYKQKLFYLHQDLVKLLEWSMANDSMLYGLDCDSSEYTSVAVATLTLVRSGALSPNEAHAWADRQLERISHNKETRPKRTRKTRRKNSPMAKQGNLI